MSSNRCKPKGSAPACACGCGQKTLWNGSKNRWSQHVNGHQNIGRKSLLRKEKPPAPACACGCGEAVRTWRYSRGWAKYLNGHAPRKPHTPEAIEKMRIAAQKRKKFGADTPSWRGGIAEETRKNHPGTRSPWQWRKIIAIVHERDGHQCILCGKTGRLDTHHVNGDYNDNRLENLVSVCHRCHMRVELSSDSSYSERLAAYVKNSL